jgi:hypothetical protein
MGTIPATGSAITFGKVNQAFNNNAPNAAGNAPSGGQNIKLSAVLGVSYGGKSAGAQISFSSTFGGKTSPYTYTP